MDSNFLKPEKLIELCRLLDISPKNLYDKYYNFVLSNYGEVLVNYRKKNRLNQKQFAKLLSISPVDLSLFERKLKYPTRNLYAKLKEVLK
jgi:ribosome-binding protein aMBF1 (putative translation factor)